MSNTYFDPDLFLTPNPDLDLKHPPYFEPESTPVSMIDVDRMPPMSMDIPMSDGCPQCGGHNMRVGDYVCWGVCYGCYEQARKEYYAEAYKEFQ